MIKGGSSTAYFSFGSTFLAVYVIPMCPQYIMLMDLICLLARISFSKKIKKQLTVCTKSRGEIFGEIAWNNVAVGARMAVSGICGTY
ncbi:MAG: hypothetical protein P4L55_14315 [Syntrophobacteraceae bacterium]|nr:hypothetical protein [Syntrophobacteraceae bacterium]